MNNFCENCGSRLDIDTGLCPKCDIRKLKKSKRRLNKKSRKKITAVLVVFIVSAVLILFNDITKILSISNRMDIPEADMTGFQYYESSAENIVTDEGITFVNNEILIYLESEQDKGKLEEYLDAINGKIVGEIAVLSEYQILLEENCTYKEMMDLVNHLEKLDGILWVVPNYAVKTNATYIPNDKKWKNEWKNVVAGRNWGMEAIDAPGAWEYKDQFDEVNIGIIDTMFDVKHKDLKFSSQPLGNIEALNKVQNGEIEWDDHGTHVAGTIAASFDNNRGVAGVSVKTNLYGVSVNGMRVEEYTMLQFWQIAFSYLIAGEQCSVVNVSMGYSEMAFNASRRNAAALKELKDFSDSISDFFELLIDKKYQFVICASAGNQNSGGDEKYYLKDEYNEDEYAYYSKEDYEKYQKKDENETKISDQNSEEIKKRNEFFSRYEKELEIPVKCGGRLDRWGVDAKYEVFGAITNKKVKERLIIVGAVENLVTYRKVGFLGIREEVVHKGYKLTDFSQRGKQVDIVAPGREIESTVKYGYKEDEGTSMASPHVAGVAGLVFSVNSGFSGEMVKQIVCNSAEGSYGDEGYGLVNAKNAVKAVMDYVSKSNEETSENIVSDVRAENKTEKVQPYSGERDIALVLDVSSSMEGTPLEETKAASVKFIDTILKESARIGVITYESEANRIADFSTNREALIKEIENVSEGGSTNIEAGLKEAEKMLEDSNAQKKIIVLMSDGEPNEGKIGEELTSYTEKLTEQGIIIYTLGFFENMGDNRAEAQHLMEEMASDGCHYEVSSAEDLVFFFDDIADQINGQKYIYIRIACPVEVFVTYDGETLSSLEEKENFRTEFGTLTFEENKETDSDNEKDRIKILRLKEGEDYQVHIVGTGRGIMNYTIGFMDDDGEYSDLRRFQDVKITEETRIDTIATVSDISTLKIDEDGDGKYEKKLQATKNGYGEIVKVPQWLYAIVFGQVMLFGIIVITLLKIFKERG